MRSNAVRFVVSLATGLVTIVPAAGQVQTVCTSGTPVIVNPVDTGGSAQFASQVPATPPAPSFTAPYRWMLVDDFVEGAAGGQIKSGFVNSSPTGTAKTELFLVRNGDQEDQGLQFTNPGCTLRALVAANGTGTTTFHLVVQGAPNDGPTYTVTGNALVLRERLMSLNPVTGQPWNSNDLYYGMNVGIKNVAGTVGVGIESLVLQCK